MKFQVGKISTHTGNEPMDVIEVNVVQPQKLKQTMKSYALPTWPLIYCIEWYIEAEIQCDWAE